ncbi:hypothetical protein N2152v2_009611 [Parachlorella kessleri]
MEGHALGVLPRMQSRATSPSSVRSLLNGQKQSSKQLQEVLQHYLSNEELEAYLRDYVSRCSNIARLDSAGKSVEGRELWVLEISDKAGQEEAEPNVKFVGNVHGDEPTGRVLSLALAEWLCANYKTHSQAQRIVNDLHLYIMPSMNPDGFVAKSRENKHDKDLNRNFPDRYSRRGMQPTGKEEPETAALMDWTLKTGFVAAASFHEGAVLANYPWDGTPNRTTEYWACPDDATFKHLARTYASAHRTMAKSQEFKDGITNGAAWYPIYGSMQDWNYIVGKCLELTLELSDNKWPPEMGLAALWEDNRQALLDFAVTAALGGLRGTVKGQTAKLRAGKGQEVQPIVADITVAGIDFTVSSRQRFGDFYRPLAPGQYGILVSSDGYLPFSTNITVPADGSGAVLDVILQQSVGAGSDMDADVAGPSTGGSDEQQSGTDSLSGGLLDAAGGGGVKGSSSSSNSEAQWRASRWVGTAGVRNGLQGTNGLVLVVAGALVLQALWVVQHRLRWRLQLGSRSRGE